MRIEAHITSVSSNGDVEAYVEELDEIINSLRCNMMSLYSRIEEIATKLERIEQHGILLSNRYWEGSGR